MEKYTKIAVVVVLCVLAASAGFFASSLSELKGPTDYSDIDAGGGKGFPPHTFHHFHISSGYVASIPNQCAWLYGDAIQASEEITHG